MNDKRQDNEPPWYVIRMPGGVGEEGHCEMPPYPD